MGQSEALSPVNLLVAIGVKDRGNRMHEPT